MSFRFLNFPVYLDISLNNNFISKKNCDIMISAAESIAKQLAGLRKSLK